MNDRNARKLFVLYVPTMDRRRINPDTAPFLHDLLGRYPVVTLETMPTTELTPTMMTGVYPHEHKLWQVEKRDEADIPMGLMDRMLDALPDVVTTTAQCVRHLFDPAYDLAAVPRRRRRQFILHRMKYTRRSKEGQSIVEHIGGIPSVFAIVDQSRYHFHKCFDDMGRHLGDYPNPALDLEYVEFYALDLFTHWHLDKLESVHAKMRMTDEFARTIHRQCEQRGVTFAFLTDHGQEPVRATLDLKKKLRETGVPQREYLYFLEVAQARFWFKTDRARDTIVNLLRGLPHVRTLHYTEMGKYHVHFDDPRFGEFYCIPDHGTIFHPHDFRQRIANLYVGLRNHEQRPRLFNSIHRGYHGHLPDHPSEEGFLVVADEGLKPVAARAALIDVAPTMLDLCGAPPSAQMHGRPMFRRDVGAAV
jgi:hypothetical protein